MFAIRPIKEALVDVPDEAKMVPAANGLTQLAGATPPAIPMGICLVFPFGGVLHESWICVVLNAIPVNFETSGEDVVVTVTPGDKTPAFEVQTRNEYFVFGIKNEPNVADVAVITVGAIAPGGGGPTQDAGATMPGSPSAIR